MNSKRRRIEKKIIKALMPFHPEQVYLFGSWARNEADDLSDVDVVVIKKTRLPFLDRLLKVRNLFPDDMGAVDVLVYTPEEFSNMKERGNAFALTIEEEGALIWNGKQKI